MPRQEETHGRWAWVVQGLLWWLWHLAFYPWQVFALLPICFAIPYIAQRRRNTWVAIIIHLQNGIVLLVCRSNIAAEPVAAADPASGVKWKDIPMEGLTSTDLKRLLHDLATSSSHYLRRHAADELGHLSISNDEIVQALAAAVAIDSDADVRSAALQALQSPVHQALLKDHPDFLREAMKSAAQNQAQEKERDEAKIMAEYLRRRTRERIYYLILFGSMLTSGVLLVAGLFQGWFEAWMVGPCQVVVIAPIILIFYLSWRNWRCPACDSWLGGFTSQINAIWSPHTVCCPHCGKRLL